MSNKRRMQYCQFLAEKYHYKKWIEKRKMHGIRLIAIPASLHRVWYRGLVKDPGDCLNDFLNNCNRFDSHLHDLEIISLQDYATRIDILNNIREKYLGSED